MITRSCGPYSKSSFNRRRIRRSFSGIRGDGGPNADALDEGPAGCGDDRLGLGGTSDTAPSTGSVSLDFLEPCSTPSRIGKLGVYEIIEVIGHGGMGIVLKAYDTKLHRVVAIKSLAPALATNGTAVKRFLREAQAAGPVSHDHVVTIFAVDEASVPPYLVMECIAGQSLQQKIDRNGPLEPAEILRIGMQISEGLAAAHKQGLIHRDIKPSNILLKTAWNVRRSPTSAWPARSTMLP